MARQPGTGEAKDVQQTLHVPRQSRGENTVFFVAKKKRAERNIRVPS